MSTDLDKILLELKQINSRLDNIDRRIDLVLLTLKSLSIIERTIRAIDGNIQRLRRK